MDVYHQISQDTSALLLLNFGILTRVFYSYNFPFFNLKLLATTLTELSAIAAPVIVGLIKYTYFNPSPQNTPQLSFSQLSDLF